MSIAAIEGIKLSQSSAAAWRSAGVQSLYPRRIGHPLTFLQAGHNVVLNLGSRAGSVRSIERMFDGVLYNPVDVVNITTSQEAFSLLMQGLTPEDLMETDAERTVWLKGPGHGGKNKFQLGIAGQIYEVPPGFVVQQHIEGEEWRLHSVNDRIVQSHRRVGENGNREYQWVGVKSTPLDLREMVKEAVRRLNECVPVHTLHTVLAWDLIHDGDRPYVLEANTAPGMNSATAERIIRQVRRNNDTAE